MKANILSSKRTANPFTFLEVEDEDDSLSSSSSSIASIPKTTVSYDIVENIESEEYSEDSASEGLSLLLPASLPSRSEL
jgi:hypothetical protein